jgi:hypothetical protein
MDERHSRMYKRLPQRGLERRPEDRVAMQNICTPFRSQFLALVALSFLMAGAPLFAEGPRATPTITSPVTTPGHQIY